ncbi:MAG: rhodanese-like domain-containing protein [Nitrospiraceae bacterium]|nr:MAG: rhodanese-like domain-containing protein [Nitrospiraceae bacterium]
MVKKIVILTLAAVFLAAGMSVQAADFSDNALKQIEELKILSRDKKEIPESFAGVNKITAAELKSWIDQKKTFVLLDNRVPADYEKEHIAGAVRLSPDDLLEKGIKAAEQAGLKKDDTIVFYCNGIKCWRSSGAIVLLQDAGYKNLIWFRDGIPEWIKKGYDTAEGK